MFVVLLKFAANRDQAGQHMDGHKAWLQRGFDDGDFVLAGSLSPAGGGAIIAHNTGLAELERRVAEDPFVEHGVVTPEIISIDPSRTDARLDFLKS